MIPTNVFYYIETSFFGYEERIIIKYSINVKEEVKKMVYIIMLISKRVVIIKLVGIIEFALVRYYKDYFAGHFCCFSITIYSEIMMDSWN